MKPARTIHLDSRPPLTTKPRRPPAAFRPSAPEPAPTSRDFDQELQVALQGLHQAIAARERIVGIYRERLRDSNSLIREYRRRIAQAQARGRPKSPIA